MRKPREIIPLYEEYKAFRAAYKAADKAERVALRAERAALKELRAGDGFGLAAVLASYRRSQAREAHAACAARQASYEAF
jgi:hypothetical protein